MKITGTPLNGLMLIEAEAIADHRGFFMESYHKRIFKEGGIDIEFVQDNHSLSKSEGTLRGLHFQEEPMAQSKLVRVIAGSVFDVAVDIRPDSAQYGQWFGVVLSAENKKQLFIPKGFAHGFLTLEPNTEVVYKVDRYYSKAHDRGIRWDDPSVGIQWPESQPILSEKDSSLPLFGERASDG